MVRGWSRGRRTARADEIDMFLPTLTPDQIRENFRRAYSSPRNRRWARRIVVALLVFGAVLYLGAPPLIRHYAEHQLSQLLRRPVSVGRITLNPYTLKLTVEQLAIGEPAGSTGAATAPPFLTLAKLVVRPSWTSLLRLKPIIGELYLDKPSIHLVRTGEARFNFSDLVDSFSRPTAPAGKPVLFSISNIHLDDGRIDLDDQVTGTHHVLDQWRVGIPFIANLPSDENVFVQPLLQARIDGSMLRVSGTAKPFSDTLASTLTLQLDQFDLTRLLPYVRYFAPQGLPLALQRGALSTQLTVAFARAASVPQITLSGTVDLHDLALAGSTGEPILRLARLHIDAAEIQPLRSIAHFSDVRIDAPSISIARDARGRFNLPTLNAASDSNPSIRQNAEPNPPSATRTTGGAPFDLALAHFELNDGSVEFSDGTTRQPARLALTQIGVKLANFSTVQAGAAPFSVQMGLPEGGAFKGSGTLNLPARQAQVQLGLSQFALSPLQPWMTGVFNGRVADGRVALQATLAADWHGSQPNLTAGPARLDLSNLKVTAAQGTHDAQPVVALEHGTVQLAHFDLAAREIQLAAVELDHPLVSADRAADGTIDLTTLMAHAAAPAQERRQAQMQTGAQANIRPEAHPAPAPAWHYQLADLKIADGTIGFVDHGTAQPVSLTLTPLQLNVSHISDAFGTAWPFEIRTRLNRKGNLSVQGRVRLSPLDVNLHLQAKQWDVAAFEPYFGTRLNASIASALFDADGDLAIGRHDRAAWYASYRGNAALNSVRMLDKQSTDLFAGWRSLAVSQIRARYDEHGTDIDAGRVALDSFYGRIFLDQNGRLNLRNFIAAPEAAPTSLTRVAATAPAQPPNANERVETTASAANGPQAASSVAAGPPSSAAAVNLHFGAFVLRQGHINYTDDFIKPNFTANLIDIDGRVGAFGSHTTDPASVDIKASLDGRGPVTISGMLNPLTSPPTLDLTAGAQGIELTSFTPYSTKYAGYPITEGRLNIDLHYVLDQNKLTADNHLFIDQLTFGDRVENTTATHLPVTLAVALLKNSRGQIDVDIPVSGSLSDPQFSLGGLIWHAVVNLLEKAVTAPFTLLANAFGGSTAQLQYVAFAPGSSVLSADDEKKLQTLAQALNDKPAVKLEMSGRADPAIDGPALRRLAVERAVTQAKVKESVGHGASVDPSEIKVAPDEYDKYLKLAYKSADFKKPRNFIGLDKSLPPDQMRQLMEDNTSVTDAMLRNLAQQRVAAVRQWMNGKVPAQRLYDQAPKLGTEDVKDGGPTTRVDFTLR